MIKMVNEFKLTVVHFARPNPMQICACAWIYRWTEKLWPGPPGRGGPWAAGPWAFGPPGRWAVAGRGPRAAGPRACFLAKPHSTPWLFVFVVVGKSIVLSSELL